MQSEPVSPPPITTTCLPPARIGSLPSLGSCGSPLTRRFCCGRKSMAKWMPSSSRPGIGRSRALLGAAGEHHRVVVGEELLGRQVDADMGAVVEGHAFAFHLRDAQVDDPLLHLEVGDAVAQQAAGLGEFLEHVHVVAGARELLRAGHAGRARADDRDLLAGLRRRRLGLDPAAGDGAVGDRAFDGLDGDRVVVDVERAGRLARRRADAAGHFGEIVGGVQVARGLLPVAAIDEVVPVRDLVVHRTAGVAVRDAAIHAARRLLLVRLLGQRQHEFAPMLDALLDRLVVAVVALEFEETR